MVDPSAFAPFDFAQSYGRGLQIHQMQEEQQNKKRLADLLPQALNGDKGATAQIAGINPELFMKLDDRQREQAKAELSDMTGAVRWAMSDPAQRAQRWNQVVDFYSQHIPGVAQYRDHPEMAEGALMQLGQIGEYLKPQGAEQPSSVREYEYAKSQGFKGSYMDFTNQKGGPLVANNGDGTFTLIPRTMAGPQPSASNGEITATGPNGEKVRLNPQTNQWEPIGGQTPSASGGFL
jgi:hypothetical protein